MVEPQARYGTVVYSEDKYTELANAGYPTSKHNTKALKKSGGIVEKAKIWLAERKAKKERKNLEKYLPRLQSAGYGTQHDQLVAAGYPSAKKNLRALKKSKGDIEAAKLHLGKKKAAVYNEMIVTQGYTKKHEELVSAGYTRPHKNYHALEQNGGDYDLARKYLDERKLKRREVVYTYPSEYETWHNKLVAEGYKNRNKNYKSLRKANGDYEKARQRLQLKNEKYLDAIRTSKYEDAHAQLVAAGFVKPRRNLKHLNKVAGDVAKAQDALAAKKAKRDAYKIETKALGYDTQADALYKAGFVKRRRNYKALQSVQGDVDKAKIYLLERKRNRKLKDLSKY